jgi:small subunit ribosomal protein S5
LKTPLEEYKRHYTANELEAVEAAKALIPEKAFEEDKVRERTDPWSVDYYDDFQSIDPHVDKPVLAPWENFDETSRLKTEDEIEEDLAKLVHELPDDEKAIPDYFQKFDREFRLTVGKEEHERQPRTALQPSIPAPEKAKVKTSKPGQEGGGDRRDDVETSAALIRLMQMTGYSKQDIAKLRVKSLIVHRVVNQTRLGKISKMYFLSVAGNGNGLLGIGEGKSEEATEARLQSQYRAIRNMKPILRYENRTIYGDVKAKVSATELELMARGPGKSFLSRMYSTTKLT